MEDDDDDNPELDWYGITCSECQEAAPAESWDEAVCGDGIKCPQCGAWNYPD